MGSHNPSLLGLNVLAGTSPDSDTNCNSPNPPLIDIVVFGLFLMSSSQSFKTCMLGRGFHTLIRNVSFPSPTDVGSHNPPPLGASVFAGTSPIFGFSLSGFPSRFKTCLLERGFHALVRNVLFRSHVGSHNPPPWGPTSSLAHHLVSDSNTNCNSPNPRLADIVLFGFSLSSFPSKF